MENGRSYGVYVSFQGGTPLRTFLQVETLLRLPAKIIETPAQQDR
jgi:hypothetical protein